jgi:hypothetical protein
LYEELTAVGVAGKLKGFEMVKAIHIGELLSVGGDAPAGLTAAAPGESSRVAHTACLHPSRLI